MTAGFVGAWLGARFGARAAARRALREAPRELGALGTTSQLRELAQAVDTVAVEVERISEAQRFTAKLLAERAAAPLPPGQPGQRREHGQVTPH
jgi:hypothetical protein